MDNSYVINEMQRLLRRVDEAIYDGRGETNGPRLALADWVENNRHTLERALKAERQ